MERIIVQGSCACVILCVGELRAAAHAFKPTLALNRAAPPPTCVPSSVAGKMTVWKGTLSLPMN